MSGCAAITKFAYKFSLAGTTVQSNVKAGWLPGLTDDITRISSANFSIGVPIVYGLNVREQ